MNTGEPMPADELSNLLGIRSRLELELLIDKGY
jgi:hypothetical protein